MIKYLYHGILIIVLVLGYIHYEHKVAVLELRTNTALASINLLAYAIISTVDRVEKLEKKAK